MTAPYCLSCRSLRHAKEIATDCAAMGVAAIGSGAGGGRFLLSEASSPPLPATIGKQEAIPAPAAPAVKPKPTRMRLQAVRVKTSRAAQAEKEGVPVDRPSAQAGTPDHGGSAPSPVTANLVTAEPPLPRGSNAGWGTPGADTAITSSGSMAGRWLFVATGRRRAQDCTLRSTSSCR